MEGKMEGGRKGVLGNRGCVYKTRRREGKDVGRARSGCREKTERSKKPRTKRRVKENEGKTNEQEIKPPHRTRCLEMLLRSSNLRVAKSSFGAKVRIVPFKLVRQLPRPAGTPRLRSLPRRRLRACGSRGSVTKEGGGKDVSFEKKRGGEFGRAEARRRERERERVKEYEPPSTS